MTSDVPFRPTPYPPYDTLDEKTVEVARDLLERIGVFPEQVDAMMPYRLVHYLKYLYEPPSQLGNLTTFPNKDPVISSMEVVPDIPFWSACSHHGLPFMGHVAVGYIPNKRIAGLSKLPLLVRALAKGYWMQEHLAHTIADRLETLLEPLGVAVYISAVHTCQLLDLKQPPIPPMKTAVLRGVMLHGPAARAEFYAMAGVS